MSHARSDGRRQLGENRRLVADLLYFSRQVDRFPLEREFDLSQLVELRERARTRISWPVLFIKAYGLLSAEFAELRQTYLCWPWAHLYQHSQSVAMLAINRSTPSGDRLCWGRFIAPEEQSLVTLQAGLDEYQTGPLEQVFRRQMRLGRFPWPLRRIAWWLSLNAAGAKRAKRLGTFGLSTLAGMSTFNRFHPSCLTTSISYGPLSAEGRSLVTLICDHRVVDGAPMARALARFETLLRGPIAAELAGLASRASAA
jgi:hypothetical protein